MKAEIVGSERNCMRKPKLRTPKIVMIIPLMKVAKTARSALSFAATVYVRIERIAVGPIVSSFVDPRLKNNFFKKFYREK